MADFTSLVLRLDALRQHLARTLRDKGVETTDEETLASLVDKVALVDSSSGMNQIRNGYQLFRGNTTMPVFPELNTASFDSMYQMCYGCTALERVPTLDTSNVANMMYAFYGCTNLQEIGGLDTSRITPASEMFHGCKNLRKIGGRLDFSKVTSKIDTTFVSCSALETVIIDGPVDVDIAVNGCPKLTVESLVFLLNALSDTGNGKTCNIGAKNLAKLNATQKAIATDKGWTLT